ASGGGGVEMHNFEGVGMSVVLAYTHSIKEPLREVLFRVNMNSWASTFLGLGFINHMVWVLRLWDHLRVGGRMNNGRTDMIALPYLNGNPAIDLKVTMVNRLIEFVDARPNGPKGFRTRRWNAHYQLPSQTRTSQLKMAADEVVNLHYHLEQCFTVVRDETAKRVSGDEQRGMITAHVAGVYYSPFDIVRDTIRISDGPAHILYFIPTSYTVLYESP
ncbi:hypothetical protein K503DRAFT_786615, partial [Rhizopogon vinicolor AM-OR11-026]